MKTNIDEALFACNAGARRRTWLPPVTTNQEAIRQLFGGIRDVTGNLPPMPGVYPDYMAPIVRNAPDCAREMAKARRGMPSPDYDSSR